ncbi:MAG: hypothetical protein HYW77_00940, partial [Parcubacteria group bacterium]|nr:hypothetical protein [Parcubacteria group bacterium]
NHEEVGYKVRSYGLGSISDQDIKTASVSKGVIYGFHVDVKESVKRVAEKLGVKLRTFNIIYELVEALRKDLSELLDPEIKRTDLGRLSVLKIFKNDGRFQVIGGRAIKGIIKRGSLVEIVRNSSKIAIGKIVQLQQSKQDVAEVKEGLECGIKFEEINANPKNPLIIKEGDVLEVYEEEKILRTL